MKKNQHNLKKLSTHKIVNYFQALFYRQSLGGNSSIILKGKVYDLFTDITFLLSVRLCDSIIKDRS
jgi:hypothetical protein